MRSGTATFLKLIWGAYLVLTSIYCLLAFLPYTYFALINSGLCLDALVRASSWTSLLACPARSLHRQSDWKNAAKPNRPLRNTGLGGNRPRNLAFHSHATK